MPPRPLVTQKVVHVGEGRTQNQETIEKRRSRVKQLSHFVDSFVVRLFKFDVVRFISAVAAFGVRFKNSLSRPMPWLTT